MHVVTYNYDKLMTVDLQCAVRASISDAPVPAKKIVMLANVGIVSGCVVVSYYSKCVEYGAAVTAGTST